MNGCGSVSRGGSNLLPPRRGHTGSVANLNSYEMCKEGISTSVKRVDFSAKR